MFSVITDVKLIKHCINILQEKVTIIITDRHVNIFC